MKKINITSEIIECSNEELDPKDKELVKSAENFLDHAYAPYSKFSVSAVVLLDNGIILNGTNQENAAYPSGLCAERTTIFYANSLYPNNKILTLAISAKYEGEIVKNPITPCGACRQVILETEKRFASPIKIILAGKNKCFIINSIKDLLPLSFDDEFFE
ncbi:MAG: cytidine deaminase [Bacteroidales bacterium]|nr:cytidine deaminase [Bacteroidales bacterium]